MSSVEINSSVLIDPQKFGIPHTSVTLRTILPLRTEDEGLPKTKSTGLEVFKIKNYSSSPSVVLRWTDRLTRTVFSVLSICVPT